MTSENNKEPWYPSKYGPGDRVGAVNNLSAEGTLYAAGLISRGISVPLSIVTHDQTPTFAPRKCQMIITQSKDGTGILKGNNQISANDDLLISHCGVGTHIDGLGHIGIEHYYYNGVHASEFVESNGIKIFGTESIPPIVTRGVLLDMTRIFGSDPIIPGTPINTPEIKEALKSQDLVIKKGDVVLLHTGWLDTMYQDSENYILSESGLGVDGACYLVDNSIVAVGADNAALEVIPFEDPDKYYPVHEMLLPRNGVYILENVNTKQLADEKIYEFMFVLGVPRFRGAVQMVANPIAIF